jgi:hypothetical protein
MGSMGMGTLPVPGGPWSADEGQITQRIGPPPKGIFGEHPGATPKYATNLAALANEHADFRDTMARMFIQVGSKEEYEKFIASVKEQDPNIESLARVLAGTNLAVGNRNDGTGTGYIDFLLQNVQHQFQEKMQIVETLADSYVAYFFGQGAPIFQYSGILINSKQDDQAHNMLRIYQSMIRGYQLARRKKILRLRYNNLIVNGAAFNFGFNLAAENEMACPFNFSLLVKSIIPLRNEYSGIVVADNLFATESELQAAGFPPGTQPGQVADGIDKAPQIVVMDPPQTTTDGIAKSLSAVDTMNFTAEVMGQHFNPNDNVGDAFRASQATKSTDTFVKQRRAEIDAAQEPAYKKFGGTIAEAIAKAQASGK